MESKKISKIDFIYYYATVDIALSSVSRIFLLYCTWYFITVRHSAELLSVLLTLSWIANPAALLTGNIISRWLGYAKTVFIMSIIILLLIVSFFMIYNLTNIYQNDTYYAVILSLIALTTSFSTFILAPLATPMITFASNNSETLEKRIRILSNLFIFTLLFGTMLGGIIIGTYGGPASIIVNAIISIFGFIASAMFYKNYLVYDKYIPATKSNSMLALRDGMILVTKTPPEMMIAVISMLVNMAIIPAIFFIFPIIILKSGYSIIYVSIAEIFVGLGMMIASSFIIPVFKNILSSHQIVYQSLIFCTASLTVSALLNSVIIIFFSCFFIGVGLSLFNVTINHKRALSIPDKNLPEMESSLLFLCTISTPIGFFLSKYLIKILDVNELLLFFSFIILLALIISLISRSLKSMLNDPHVESVKYYERSYRYNFHGGES